jgi:hypothetical protein
LPNVFTHQLTQRRIDAPNSHHAMNAKRSFFSAKRL